MANSNLGPNQYRGQSGLIYDHVEVYRDDGYKSEDSNISSEEHEIERTERRWMHLHVIRTGIFPKISCRNNNCTCKNLPDWP